MTISMTRRVVLAGAAALSLTGPVLAQSATASRAKFTQAAFEAAQVSGKPIVIEVTAPWCPTCRQQKPIIGRLATSPEFAGVTILEVDFDSQKDALRTLKATSQSTLIAFKGKTEVSRSVGETRSTEIETLFKSTL